MKSPAALKQIFDDYIATNKFEQTPVALYEPINYIFSLGGKRLRPLLLLMGYNLFGERVAEALPAAFAIEIFHNFSLLHDDIMDEAPLRRGKPSVHVKYNVNTGILSGDVMLIYAYQYLARLSALPRYAKIIELFNQLAIDVCEGQQYDMNFEAEEKVALSTYLKMIELKTAALIGGALGMGAVIGGASEKDMEQLMQFGRNIGIAFQIQDDILDTFGDPEKFGKKVGGDIVQNKKTFLFLKALEQADSTTQAELLSLYEVKKEDNTQKISVVKGIFEDLKVDVMAAKAKDEYLAKAFTALALVGVKEERKQYLRETAHILMNREL